MGRKPRVDRTPEEKWQIVQEGIKSGNVSETCRRYEIAPNLFYRWKDEAEQGAKAALGGRSAAAAETEKDRRIRQLERTLGRKPRGKLDADHRQWHAVHFFPVPGNARAARHQASANGVSSPGGQQLHRAVPSQLERGGSLDSGVPQRAGSAGIDRALDRGVQSRPASQRSRKSHSTRGLLGFHS
jgi:transposase-like protein